MTEKILRIVGVATPLASPASHALVGKYVQSFYAEAHDGRGNLIATDDVDRALRLPDVEAALRIYQRVPINRPTRPDGKPNRPMTAFHVEILDAPPKEDSP